MMPNQQTRSCRIRHRLVGLPTAAVLLASLGGCIGGVATNRSVYSEKQPVVATQSYTFDVQTTYNGVPGTEQARLDGWLDAMKLDYGDRVAIDGGADSATRSQIAALVERRGILMWPVAPVTRNPLPPGVVRVVLTRSVAYVPGCPDWSANSDANPFNATYPGYGCAVNANLAVMIAEPEDLLRGQRDTGETVIMSSTKAIESYRRQVPTGEAGLLSSEGRNRP